MMQNRDARLEKLKVYREAYALLVKHTDLTQIQGIIDAIDGAIEKIATEGKAAEEEDEPCSPSACDQMDVWMPDWWFFQCWLKRCPPMEP